MSTRIREIREKKKISGVNFAPEARPLLIEKLFEFYKDQRGKVKSEAEYAKKEYARVQRAIDNLLRLVEQGKATDSVIEQVKPPRPEGRGFWL